MSLNRYIAISVDPSTETGALAAAKSLRQGGWNTELFLSTGTESRFEEAVLFDLAVQAVLDYSLCQLVSARMGVAAVSVPERLTSAAVRGLPQVIVPGGLDHFIVPGPLDLSFNRESQQVDEVSRAYRTSQEDNDVLGKELAFKASASSGPIAIVFPMGGLSQWDCEGSVLHDIAADRVLLDSLHLWKAPHVELVESHRHINDPLFAQIVVDQLLKLMVIRQ